MSLLGLDIGTTACKAVVFDLHGQPLAAASREYRLRTPAPGRIELDANEVWDAVKTVVREVNSGLRDPVEAIATSAQGEAVTPIGRDGSPLAPSQITFDTRATPQAAKLADRIGRQRLFQIAGHPPHPMFSIAKIMWWAEHEPDIVAQTWKFLCYGDLVTWKLGGEPVIDFSMAARTMAFDIERQVWSDEVLAAASIPMSQMPVAAPSSTPVDRVSPDMARELGFVGRPLLVAGGHDQPCGAYGANASAPGEAMFSIGTTACLAPVFAQRALGLMANDYCCYPHVAPGRWITLAGNFTGGSLLRWYRDTFGAGMLAEARATGRDFYDLLTEEAGDEPSPLLVLPHFGGSGAPHNDPVSKGAIVGMGFGTTRGQIVRALLEGVMFEIALNREMLAAAGVDVAGIVAIGGGARSDRWLRITADILGVPVRRASQTEAACWGAARLAGTGAGLLTDERLANDAGSSDRFQPDPKRSDYYRQRLPLYRELYGALRPLNAAL